MKSCCDVDVMMCYIHVLYKEIWKNTSGNISPYGEMGDILEQ